MAVQQAGFKVVHQSELRIAQREEKRNAEKE